MFISTQIALRLWLMFVSIGAAASLSLAIRTPSPDGPLRVGFCDWPGSECLLLAEQLGYFADEGVQVELFNFQSLTDTRRAFERGQLHGACGTLVEVLQTDDHTGRDPQIVYATSFSTGADVLLGQPHLASLADLHGKRVGVEVASISAYMLSRALEQAGMTLDDVQLVLLDVNNLQAAFADGTIDAAVTYTPFSHRLRAAHATRTLFDSSAIPNEIIDLIYFDEQTAQTRTDDIHRMLRAYERAVQFLMQHPESAIPSMAHRLGISQEHLQKTYQAELRLCRYDDQAELLSDDGPLQQAAQRVQRQLISIGQIQRRAHRPVSAFRIVGKTAHD